MARVGFRRAYPVITDIKLEAPPAGRDRGKNGKNGMAAADCRLKPEQHPASVQKISMYLMRL